MYVWYSHIYCTAFKSSNGLPNLDLVILVLETHNICKFIKKNCQMVMKCSTPIRTITMKPYSHQQNRLFFKLCNAGICKRLTRIPIYVANKLLKVM